MTVVLATDFSPGAEKARRVAVQLCRRSGDRLVVAHVLDPLPAVALFGAELPDLRQSLHDAAQIEMKRQLEALQAEGIEVEARLVEGFAPEAIATLAAREAARLIVLGSHGRSLAGRLLAGSVADEVAAAAERPVLVVRGEDPALASRAAPRLRVLLALDGSHAGDAAVALLRELRGDGPVDVVVGHCYWPPGEYHRLGLAGPASFFQADPEVARVIERELRARLADLPGEGSVSYRIAPVMGRAAEPLSRWASEEKADLILVGTHGRHGLARLWHGSVARDLLHVSRVPVLCAPAAGQDPPAATIPEWSVVVAASDLSRTGARAVAQAYAAVAPGGRVELLFVHERPMPSPSYVYEPGGPELAGEERAHVEAELRKLVPEGAARRGVSTEVVIGEARTAGEGILQHAERVSADLVVIGAHGRTGSVARLMGSAAEAVLRGSRRPVLMVPAET
jgi:nucleotide-binding universal stress UspA family protein